MATILIQNSNFHHHVHKQHLCPSRCGRNPTTVSLNFSSNLIHHSNLRASVPANKPRQRRGARIVNSSEKEKESIQSSSEGMMKRRMIWGSKLHCPCSDSTKVKSRRCCQRVAFRSNMQRVFHDCLQEIWVC
nr:uncharacterized protein LOC113691813 isoform X1 [Coffea arabica]